MLRSLALKLLFHLLSGSCVCSISSRRVPSRSNVKRFSPIMQQQSPLPASHWSLGVPARGVTRLSLHAIGRVSAGGVSSDFIHKSTSGASLRHVSIPLFMPRSTCPGSASASGGEHCRAEEGVPLLQKTIIVFK